MASERQMTSNKNERSKSYRKNSKMLRNNRGISDCCAIYSLPRNIRSCHLEMFCKKGVLENFAKFTGKYLGRSLFFK